MKQHEPGPDSPKEQAILNAALEVFVERGSSGARMQEIADRAGVNKTLLHYYFRRKENIYRRVVEHAFMTFFGAIERALTAEDDFEASLKTFIDTLMDVAAANPRLPLFVMAELSQGGATARAILEEVFRSRRITMPQRMVALIRRNQEAGEIRPVDPPQLMLTLLGSCIYYFVTEPIVQTMLGQIDPDRQYDRAVFIAERKKSIYDVIYYGLKRRD